MCIIYPHRQNHDEVHMGKFHCKHGLSTCFNLQGETIPKWKIYGNAFFQTALTQHTFTIRNYTGKSNTNLALHSSKYWEGCTKKKVDTSLNTLFAAQSAGDHLLRQTSAIPGTPSPPFDDSCPSVTWVTSNIWDGKLLTRNPPGRRTVNIRSTGNFTLCKLCKLFGWNNETLVDTPRRKLSL